VINLETGHEAIYDDVMADTTTRLVAICNDMPTLMGQLARMAQRSRSKMRRAVSLALLILDDCSTRVWAVRRNVMDGQASANGIGHTANTSLLEKT
jgi:hypothetical protein